MRLDKLCAAWVTAPAVELTGLTADSRQVEPGFLFVKSGAPTI